MDTRPDDNRPPLYRRSDQTVWGIVIAVVALISAVAFLLYVKR